MDFFLHCKRRCLFLPCNRFLILIMSLSIDKEFEIFFPLFILMGSCLVNCLPVPSELLSFYFLLYIHKVKIA